MIVTADSKPPPPPPSESDSPSSSKMNSDTKVLPPIMGDPPEYSARDDQGGALPKPSVDQVHISEKKEDITGVFYIDPSVKALSRVQNPRSRGKGKKKQSDPPHASFRTRRGCIELDLGTTGDLAEAAKANVVADTRSGDVRINLLPSAPTRPRIGLSASSRTGDVIVYIPETFSGVLQLSTHRGKIMVLPALAKTLKTVKDTEEDKLFLVQSAGFGPTERQEDATSHCQAYSRSGKVVVGLYGRDEYKAKVGLFQKLGQMMKGS